MVTLTLIGNLVYCWSNNESLFIYILMLLMESDETSAAVVFGTLNTTRARIDLIERLAKLKIRDQAIEKKLDDIIERFNDTTRIRNEFNHCMYVRRRARRNNAYEPHAGSGSARKAAAWHRAPGR